MTYSKGSDAMYSDYDNLIISPKKKNLRLGIANSRGRKPVIRQIDKARKLIDSIMIEINSCSGKTELNKIRNTLLDIVNANE